MWRVLRAAKRALLAQQHAASEAGLAIYAELQELIPVRLVANNDPMTMTGPQVRALVEELFGRVDIATMRAGVELADAEFERLNESLDEPGYLVAAILVRDYFMRCSALRVV